MRIRRNIIATITNPTERLRQLSIYPQNCQALYSQACRQLAFGGSSLASSYRSLSSTTKKWSDEQSRYPLAIVRTSPFQKTKQHRLYSKSTSRRKNTADITDKRATLSTTAMLIQAGEEEDEDVMKSRLIENIRDWESLTDIPLQPWSKKQLLDVQITNNNDVAKLALDVSCRLHHQFNLLNEIQEIVNELQENPQIQSKERITATIKAREPPSSSSRNDPTTSNSISPSALQQRRPYWWTYSNEEQLQHELQNAIQSIQDLKRLHQDTLTQSMYEYEQCLQRTKSETSLSEQQRGLSLKRLQRTYQEIQDRHALTIETMAENMIGLRPLQQPPDLYNKVIQFLQARITVQLLCDHIVSLVKEQKQKRQYKQDSNKPTAVTSKNIHPHRYGALTIDQPILSLVQAAIYEANYLCEAHFLTRPSIRFVDNVVVADNKQGQTKVYHENSSIQQRKNMDEITSTLIRPWLQYTLVELFKNSMAVTIERPNPKCARQHSQSSSKQPDENTDGNDNDDDEDALITKSHCPIYVNVVETENDVRIQILDQGGGFVQSENPKSRKQSVKDLFTFAQCSQKWDRINDQQTYATVRSPIRGLGVGLSMSLLQMQHLGGDLILTDRSEQNNEQQQVQVKIKGVRNDDDETSPTSCQWYTLEPGITATIVIQNDTEIAVP